MYLWLIWNTESEDRKVENNKSGKGQEINDLLPDCQRDAFLPIRVKGRNTGNPQWGQLEILKDGQWVDYSM